MKTLKNILSGFDFPSEILVVEYSFGDTDKLYATHLKSKGNEVNLEGSYAASSVQEILALSSFSCPVQIIFTGKKVLSKKVEAKDNAEEDELKARAFPSISKENLIFQIDELDEGKFVVSAIRQDIALKVIDEIKSLKLEVLDVALGDYTNWPLLSQSAKSTTRVGRYDIDLNFNALKVVENDDKEVQLFDQTIHPNYTASFLYGIQSLATHRFSSELPLMANSRIEWKYGQFFKKGILVAALFFFVLLLINFLLYTHYSSKNSELNQLTHIFDSQFNEVALLKNAYEEKNEFLKVNGATNSRVGRLGDEIASIMPKELSLSKMAFQPVLKVLKKENLVRFSRNEIQIQGSTENYASFQGWLTRLRGLVWVGDIEIVGYQETDSRHKADFSITIKLKDE